MKGNSFGVASGVMGWTLDAFDFFVVVFIVDILAARFHVPKSAIVWTITATLAMRPVGALIFGALADRYGRRGPLMGVVIYFSVIEFRDNRRRFTLQARVNDDRESSAAVGRSDQAALGRRYGSVLARGDT